MRILRDPAITNVEGAKTADNDPYFQTKQIPESLKGQSLDIDDSDLESINTPLGGTNRTENEDGELEGDKESSFKLKLKDEPAKDETQKETETETTQRSKESTEKSKTDIKQETKGGDKPTQDAGKKGLLPSISEQKGTQQEKQGDISQSGSRDYSSFPPEVADALKKTPNSVFNTIRDFAEKSRQDVLAAQEELKTKLQGTIETKSLDERGIPLNYSEHPHAYTLTPEYQVAQIQLSRADYEEQFWKEQLSRIESNEPWQDFRGWYEKSGQPAIYETPIEDFSGRAKAHIISELQKSQGTKAQFNNHIQQLAGSYQQRHKIAVAKIDDFQMKEIPWAKDEKAPQWENVKKFVEHLPQEFNNNPLAKTSGMLFAIICDLTTKLNEANQTKILEAKAKQDESKLEETVKTTVSEESPQQNGYTGTQKVTGNRVNTGINRVVGEVDLTDV